MAAVARGKEVLEKLRAVTAFAMKEEEDEEEDRRRLHCQQTTFLDNSPIGRMMVFTLSPKAFSFVSPSLHHLVLLVALHRLQFRPSGDNGMLVTGDFCSFSLTRARPPAGTAVPRAALSAYLIAAAHHHR